MKLLRYGPAGAEKPGVLADDGTIRDLSGVVADLGGETLSHGSIEKIRAASATAPAVSGDPRIGCAVGSAPNILCIGLNYRQHAAETGAEPPAEPIIFNKHVGALSGPYDDVILPKDSVKGDWEVELGFVIGEETYHVSEADALSRISAYCLINDVSEREFQIERLGQWTKGKSAPTFCPVGPWLVTPDELGDPQTLALWSKVSGVTMQNSSTSDMIFSVAEIVSYVSRFMKLMPGDVFATGTPEGVGMGMKPQRFLRAGDVMELGIDGLGTQSQTVRAFPG